MNYFNFNIICVILSIFLYSCSNSNKVTWNVMKKYKFEEVFLEKYQMNYKVPKFGKKISTLEGKEIQITGYIIPIDIEQDYYVLSQKPYTPSTFCGNRHFPETIIEVQIMGKHSKFKINQIITLKGKLKLNTDDIYQLWHILEDAKVVE